MCNLVHFMALPLGVILIGHKYCVKHLNEKILKCFRMVM